MPAAARRTTRYEKVVLTPGVYRVVKDGKLREVDSFSPERIHRIASAGQAMLDNGLQIPLPFVHFDSEGQLPSPVVISADGKELDPITGEPAKWKSTDNGGWVSAWFVNDEGALVAVVDTFGDKDDLTTPAGKIGTTIKETSLGLAAEYTDGKGRIYTDAPIHVNACLKAVEPNQTNFNLIEEEQAKLVTGPLSLVSMSSQLMKTNLPKISTMGPGEYDHGHDRPANPGKEGISFGPSPGAGLPQVLELLRQLKSPIDLPADTSEDTLIDRLSTALLQKLADEKSADEADGGVPQPPKSAKEKTGSRLQTMSTATQLPPPDQTAVVTPPAPTKMELTMMSMLVNNTKDTLTTRAAALVKRGVPQKWVDDNILSKLEVTTMSAEDFSDSGVHKNHFGIKAFLDLAESMFAAMPTLTTMSLNGGIDYAPLGASEIRPPADEQAKLDQQAGEDFLGELVGYAAAE